MSQNTNTEKAEVEQFYEDLQDLEQTPKPDVLFIIGDWNAKVESHEIPGVTDKFGLGIQNEAGQKLTKFCQENTLVIANTSSNNARDDFTRGHHQMVSMKIRLIIFFAAKDGRSFIQSIKTRPGNDCGWDHELLIVKFRLKKGGKTTRPFRYELNQIPYIYTVEVTKRFKGLDLIEYLKNYEQRFITLYRRQ